MELHLQFQLIRLESLLIQTTNEPRLKGPFPVAVYRKILVTCTGVLDQLHSLRCIVQRDEWTELLGPDSEVWTGKVGQWRREMVGNALVSGGDGQKSEMIRQILATNKLARILLAFLAFLSRYPLSSSSTSSPAHSTSRRPCRHICRRPNHRVVRSSNRCRHCR